MQTAREIETICKIQELLNQIGFQNKINLPSIIVIGSQSSGKSSVLEHIAGIDFLPRGQGIVTRRPVIIQRIVDTKIQTDYAYTEETGKISISQLEPYLTKKMKEAAQTQLGVSNQPVVVKIISSQGVALSMIDMPGLTKIALQGQNENFPKILEDMNRLYIQNPNSILLAVSPANVDVANSDALKLAREYDLKGERTIGVFTKMDLVEDPHTITKAFEGRAYSLKMGYYGIKCRNQKEINSNVSINMALQNEKSFFAQNQLFQQFHLNCGIPNLIYQLNKSLLEKIKTTLPYLKSTLKNLMKEKQGASESFRNVNQLYQSKNYQALLFNLVNKFTQNFQQVLRGGSSSVKIQDKIFGGAKINMIFQHDFRRKLDTKNMFEQIRDDEIYWTIKNSQGLQQTTSFSTQTFETFAKKQMVLLKDPCYECLVQVSEELKNIAKDVMFEMKELQLFNLVSQEIQRNFEQETEGYFKRARDAIDLYIKVQAGSINQRNKHFVVLRDQILAGQLNYYQKQKTIKTFFSKSQESFSEKKEVIQMKNLLKAYSNVIKDDIYDFVPKCILTLFVNDVTENIEQSLSNKILQKQNPQTLCQIDKQKISNLQDMERESESLRKTLALLENIN